MEGYGTDALIYLKVSERESSSAVMVLIHFVSLDSLKAFSDEANELLPIFNKTSSRFYKATVPTGDWSNQVKYKKTHAPTADSAKKQQSETAA